MHSIKLSGYRIGIKFDKNPLARKQINYLTKIINVSVVYNLDDWPRNPGNNFKFKNRLFRATSVVKSSNKEKCVYSGYKTISDNGTTRNVIIFGVDNSSTSHSDNGKNIFLILCEGNTFGINGRFGSSEKKVSIYFSKANKKFCLNLHYNADNSCLFVNGK